MPIKLLALDIDGTLLTSRGELTSRNRNAIEELQRRGVEVVLLTGRRFGSAFMLIQELELDLPLISHNGALTKDTKTLETLNLYPLEVEIAHEVVGTARESGIDMICCCDEPRGLGKMVVEGISETNIALQRYLKKYRAELVEVPDLIEFVSHPPIQIMFSGNCDRMEDFAQRLGDGLGEKIRIFKTRYRSVDLTILDAVSAQASKGESLAKIAQMHRIDRAEVMAIGDNHNDLTMLHYAGVGVVMANAEEDLKQLGFATTASNEEHGVAVAIEKYILRSNQNVDNY